MRLNTNVKIRLATIDEAQNMANKDADDVQIISRKISEQFARIEAVEMQAISSHGKL